MSNNKKVVTLSIIKSITHVETIYGQSWYIKLNHMSDGTVGIDSPTIKGLRTSGYNSSEDALNAIHDAMENLFHSEAAH